MQAPRAYKARVGGLLSYSCKLQGHIKHEWEGYLGDMGQRCKAKNGEDPGLPPFHDKSVRAWLPKADKHCLMAEQVPTLLNGGASTQNEIH